MEKALMIHHDDDLAVALKDMKSGETVNLSGKRVILINDVQAKHKFSLKKIPASGEVRMYGVVIGKANDSINKGEVITINNLKHAIKNEFSLKGQYQWNPLAVSDLYPRYFQGYHRNDGRVGTHNFWIVAPLVFCENRNIEVMREIMEEPLGYKYGHNSDYDLNLLISQWENNLPPEQLEKLSITKGKKDFKKGRVFENIDGVKFLTHEAGCGGTRKDSQLLCRLLAGYITHPNVGGATILSLGCQNAEVRILNEAIHQIDPEFDKPLYILGQQDYGLEQEFIEDAVRKTFAGLTITNKVIRQKAPVSSLVVGLECGGSDGFSGISANPAVGKFSDILVSMGGSVILSEFPELNGVEHILAERCKSSSISEKFLSLMEQYQSAAKNSGSGFEANPSPGNIKDGLITDAMKSAGAALKGGSSPVVDVLDYTDQLRTPGLNLLCTPGNDVESTTGLAGSGAQIILFTTGLGTPTGNPVAPVIKISSNSALYRKMEDIIDIDAGGIIENGETIDAVAFNLFNKVIETANGGITKAQLMGQNDFIPWKRGVSL